MPPFGLENTQFPPRTAHAVEPGLRRHAPDVAAEKMQPVGHVIDGVAASPGMKPVKQSVIVGVQVSVEPSPASVQPDGQDVDL